MPIPTEHTTPLARALYNAITSVLGDGQHRPDDILNAIAIASTAAVADQYEKRAHRALHLGEYAGAVYNLARTLAAGLEHDA
jgi:hypothetical protein